MLANFLNKSKPINFIGLLIFFFISFLSSVYFTFFPDSFTVDSILKSLALLLLFVIIFFIFNFIVGKNKLTFDNSYAYFLFTLLSIIILSDLLDYKSLILTIIYLLFIRKIYSLRSIKSVLEKLYDSGFWLGFFFISEPFSIFLFVLIYVASYLHKKITIQTLLVPIIGFITPLIIYFTYFFWVDKTEKFTNLFSFEFNFNLDFYAQKKYFWTLICLLFFTICTIFFKSIKTLSVNNKFRKSWILLITNFFILIPFLFFLPNKNGSELIFILFPVSVILANGIELIKKNTFKNLVLYFFLVCSIILHYWL